MKINQLITGDIILHGEEIMWVCGLLNGGLVFAVNVAGELREIPIAEVSPVKITGEILVRLGYTKEKDIYYKHRALVNEWLEVRDDRWSYWCCACEVRLDGVHHLQNIMLGLYGIDIMTEEIWKSI